MAARSLTACRRRLFCRGTRRFILAAVSARGYKTAALATLRCSRAPLRHANNGQFRLQWGLRARFVDRPRRQKLRQKLDERANPDDTVFQEIIRTPLSSGEENQTFWPINL